MLYLKAILTKKEILDKYTRLPKVIDQDQGITYLECPVCGKHFAKYTSIRWAYKLGYCYYCSYGCVRKAETLVESIKDKRGRRAVIAK